MPALGSTDVWTVRDFFWTGDGKCPERVPLSLMHTDVTRCWRSAGHSHAV